MAGEAGGFQRAAEGLQMDVGVCWSVSGASVLQQMASI